jgi:uncharacterized membrane protein YdbT with pleckstrin-like domain
MSKTTPSSSQSVLWTAKPWILPGTILRTVAVMIVAIIVFWIELYSVIADFSFPDIPLPLWAWTALAFFIIWILSMLHLLLLKATNTYVLHSDSLEIRTGIITQRSNVIAPSGFSDLEVVRSIPARIINSGDIIVRIQTETKYNLKMTRVRDPLRAADQIRQIMARPIVRIEGSQPGPPDQKKP